MTVWALIINGVVHESTQLDPEGRFHPGFVWVEAPVDVEVGWLYSGSNFVKPENVAPAPVGDYKHFSALDFLRLFDQERREIKTAALADIDIGIWYDDAVAAQYITYSDPRTAAGIEALLQAGLLTPARYEQVVAEMTASRQ